jgi:hypothetical protein
MRHNKYPQDAKPTRLAPSPAEVARRACSACENPGSLPGHEVWPWLKAEADFIAERNRIRVQAFLQPVVK